VWLNVLSLHYELLTTDMNSVYNGLLYNHNSQSSPVDWNINSRRIWSVHAVAKLCIKCMRLLNVKVYQSTPVTGGTGTLSYQLSDNTMNHIFWHEQNLKGLDRSRFGSHCTVLINTNLAYTVIALMQTLALSNRVTVT